MAARAGAQRTFDQDLLITNVAVTVVVEGEGRQRTYLGTARRP